jgi:hypothetical protein
VLGLSKIDPIEHGLYPTAFFAGPEPLTVQIDVDRRCAGEINERFGLADHPHVQVVPCHRCEQLALCQRSIAEDIEIPPSHEAAFAQLNSGCDLGLFQAHAVVAHAAACPITSFDALVRAVGRPLGSPVAVTFDEEIMGVACELGYTEAAAFRMVQRLRDGDPDLVATEREDFTCRACERGWGLTHANVRFDSFLRAGIPRSAAVAQAIAVYRSAYLKALYPAQALAATLRWRGLPYGITDEDELLGAFEDQGLRLSRSLDDFGLVEIGDHSGTVRVRIPQILITEVDRMINQAESFLLTTAGGWLAEREAELAASGQGFNLFHTRPSRSAAT